MKRLLTYLHRLWTGCLSHLTDNDCEPNTIVVVPRPPWAILDRLIRIGCGPVYSCGAVHIYIRTYVCTYVISYRFGGGPACNCGAAHKYIQHM